MGIAENIKMIQQEIKAAQSRSPHAADDVLLLAVSKTRDVEMIREAMAAGLQDFGENKVQEWMGKYEALPQVNWHLIGHLQTNKVKYLIGKTKLIHSLDSVPLAAEIEKRSLQAQVETDVLVQVNIAEEDSKSGLLVPELSAFLDKMADFPHVKVKGLMTIGPNVTDTGQIRPVFAELRRLFLQEKARALPHCQWLYLSMGMSYDYSIAVEEGANIVRVGSSIFGPRLYL
ncbi:MAG: YggS family pyridoxal phosphate-dependent enzyme [Firmicutes bacterium]|nr:YggS family pyridoxal phosphate-dependent enzyme [Bacillota bacterium]